MIARLGKTALAIDTILNQRTINQEVDEKDRLIFVFMFAVGQKRSTVSDN